MRETRRINFISDKYKVLKLFRNEKKHALILNHNRINKDTFKNIFHIDLESVPWYDNGYIISDNIKFDKIEREFDEYGIFCTASLGELFPLTLTNITPGDKVLSIILNNSISQTVQAGLALQGKGILAVIINNKAMALKITNKLQSFGIYNFIIFNQDIKEFTSKNKNKFDTIILSSGSNDLKDEESNYAKMPRKTRKWKLTENTKKLYNNLNYTIHALKNGGKFLYFTKANSFLEERSAIKSLLRKNQDLKISVNQENVPIKAIFNDKQSNKNIYVVLFERDLLVDTQQNTNDEDCLTDNKDSINNYIEFEQENMNISIADKVIKRGYKYYIKLNNNVDFMADAFAHAVIGMEKSNEFFPLQSLAFMLKKEDFKNYYEFERDSEEYKKFINNEKFMIDLNPGLYLIGYLGIPIGWARVRRRTLFNITKKYITNY